MWESSRAAGMEGRATPLWLWVTQRATAVLLGPLVAVHILVPGAAKNPAVGATLLVMVLAHGVTAVWRLSAEPRVGRFGYWSALVASAVVTILLAVLGFAIYV